MRSFSCPCILGKQRAPSFRIAMTRNNYTGKMLSKSSAELRNGLPRVGPGTISSRMPVRAVWSDRPPLSPDPRGATAVNGVHTAAGYWEET